MISGLKSKSYEEKCEEIGLESLKARRERQELLEAYKIIHGPERKRGEEILVIPTAREGVVTRNAADPWNLVVPRSRLDIRKHNFSARIGTR